MSINSPTGSSGVLAQQQFAPQSQATRNKPSPQSSDTFNNLATVQPPGSTSPGAVAGASGATTGPGTPSGGQTDPVSQHTNLQSYLPGLQPATIPGTADSAAAAGTPSNVADAARAAAAYMIGMGSTASAVSSAMIC